jgi:hypothetical protein
MIRIIWRKTLIPCSSWSDASEKIRRCRHVDRCERYEWYLDCFRLAAIDLVEGLLDPATW